MIIVNGRIETTAENIAHLKAAIAAMETASRAEDGCDDYTFSVELNDPNVIRITEKWREMEALAAHFVSAHMAEFQKAMRERPGKGGGVTFYEATEVEPPR